MQSSDKVLIIEKDANLLFGLRARLSALGFFVEVETGYNDPQSVFQTVSRHLPDFIIMGSGFEKFDSKELIHEIKGDPVLCKVKIFLIIDDDDAPTKKKELGYYQAGADYITVKRGNFYENFSETFKRIISNIVKTKL